MKKLEKENSQLKTIIIALNNAFHSAINSYKLRSCKNYSAGLADMIFDGNMLVVSTTVERGPTDLFILCCNADDKHKQKAINDLIVRAESNGSEFFTSVVIAYGNITAEDFIHADIIIPIEKDDIENNVKKLIQCLTEISTARGIGAVDFADIRTLFKQSNKGYFAFSECEINEGSVQKVIDKVLNAPNIKDRIKAAEGILLYIKASDERSLTELGYGIGKLESVLNENCAIVLKIIDHPENKIEISLLITGSEF